MSIPLQACLGWSLWSVLCLPHNLSGEYNCVFSRTVQCSSWSALVSSATVVGAFLSLCLSTFTLAKGQTHCPHPHNHRTHWDTQCSPWVCHSLCTGGVSYELYITLLVSNLFCTRGCSETNRGVEQYDVNIRKRNDVHKNISIRQIDTALYKRIKCSKTCIPPPPLLQFYHF